MSKGLKTTFLVHAIVAAVLGALLLLIPGRFLLWIGWQAMIQALNWENTDPFVSRILGAALLALAWSSYRGWRAADRDKVVTLIEMEAIFCVLGCAGMLWQLVPRIVSHRWFPAPGWITIGLLAAFAAAWIVFYLRKEPEGQP